jgi:DNA invertase Pin-like site-specific DNA recombinase
VSVAAPWRVALCAGSFSACIGLAPLDARLAVIVGVVTCAVIHLMLANWRLVTACAAIVACCLGTWRGLSAFAVDHGPTSVAGHLGSGAIVLRGTIADAGVPGRVDTIVVDVHDLATHSGTWSVTGSVVVEPLHAVAVLPGDTVDVATTSLRAPPQRPGALSAVSLERVGVTAIATGAQVTPIATGGPTPSRLAQQARRFLTAAVTRALPEPEATLLLGIAFGIHGTLATGVRTPLQDAGLIHIVAVSGLMVQSGCPTQRGASMNVGIYVRISDDPRSEGVGVARQEADCRELAEQRGWQIADVYSDNSVSAWSGAPRPAYRRLLADMKAGNVQAVIAWKPDRLHRNPGELNTFMELALSRGVALALVSGELDLATSGGKLMARIHSDVDTYSSDVASERVLRAMVANGEAGKPHGGPRPYGFLQDRVTHDPHEVAAILGVTGRLLAGASLRSQCLLLNASGARWESSTLKRMLLSPRLIGMREHRGNVSRAVWEPILTQEQQILLRARLTGRRRGAMHRHLLSGFTFCGVCGARLRYTGATRGNAPTMHCPPRPRGKNCVSIRAGALEAHVIRTVLSNFTGDEMPAAGVRTDDPAAGEREKLAAVRNAWTAGSVPLEDYVAFKKKADKRIADLTEKATHASAEALRAAEGATLRARWDTLTEDERRIALQASVDRIVIHKATRTKVLDPSRIHIEWHDDVISGWDMPSWEVEKELAAGGPRAASEVNEKGAVTP